MRYPYSGLQVFLSWVITPIYLVSFYSILFLFDPILRFAHLFGYTVFNFFFNLMNFCLVQNFRLAGTRVTVDKQVELPTDRPIILVSNHQSMYDIPFIIWSLRQHHPKFIAKQELGRKIPSISYSLRVMGSVLIDRSNTEQSLPAIQEFAQEIERKQYAACLFPEGTRARDGRMRKFKIAGFRTLLENMPSALVVPIVVGGSWEIVRYNLWPIVAGVRLSLTVLEPVDRKSADAGALLEEIERRIGQRLNQV